MDHILFIHSRHLDHHWNLTVLSHAPAAFPTRARGPRPSLDVDTASLGHFLSGSESQAGGPRLGGLPVVLRTSLPRHDHGGQMTVG